MNKPKLYLFLFLTIVTNLAFAADKSARILVMGDSLSAGYGIQLQEGWVHLLQQRLAGYPQWKIINASVSGETTSGGKARLGALLTEHKPAIVVLELGGNDGLRGQPLKLVQQNLQTMIDASKNSGAKVLLIGMQIPTNYGPRYTQQFKEIYPLLAEKNQLSLVPFLLEGVATNSELMQNDSIHPTADAQPRIVENVLPVLKPLLALSSSAH